MSGYAYTSGRLNIALSSVGSYTAARSMKYGRAVGNSGGLLCSNSTPPTSATFKQGWAVGVNGLRYIQKGAISGTNVKYHRGRAYTLDGRAYVSTAAATGTIQQYIDNIPYTSTGQIKASEV